MSDKQHLNITVHGRVQGVWFRASTQEVAQKLGVNGWVCNQSDGSVYLEVEAEPAILEQFKDWLREGPPNARVDKLDIEEGPLQGVTGFRIAR